MRLGDSDLVSRHRGDDTRTLCYRPLDEEFPLTFVTDPDGLVAEAVAVLDDGTEPIRFRRAPEGNSA